jgi:hypothetical protein
MRRSITHRNLRDVVQEPRIGSAALAVIGALAWWSFPSAANAADQPPTVTHNEVETVHDADDICGPRENDTTYTGDTG